MVKAKLRLNDGLASGRVWLDSVVYNAQVALRHSGAPLVPDGRFGPETLRELHAFRNAKHLAAGEEFDKDVWNHLEPHLAATVDLEQRKLRQYLAYFDGDLRWVHDREGHVGHPYWPGGEAGVVLDPGVDLGQMPFARVSALYDRILTEPELAGLQKVSGKTAEAARDALAADPLIKSILISREQAHHVMPRAAKKYWDRIVTRFNAIAAALPSVQTVMLSLAYNRGPDNPRLQALGAPLAASKWDRVADIVGAMQQDHELAVVRERRQCEASLIRAELEYLRVRY